MLFDYLKERFFLGRISDTDIWREKVLLVCTNNLYNMPVVPSDDHNTTRIKRRDSIQSWQYGSTYISLKEYYNLFRDERILKYLNFFENNTSKIIGTIDNNISSDYGMISYGISKHHENKTLEEDMLSYILNNRTKTGIVFYKSICRTNIYVDTLGMVCPFLSMESVKMKNVRYLCISEKQIKYYIDNCTEKTYHLPFHSYNIEKQIPLGICDWARGLSWMLIGIMDSFLELKDYLSDLSFYLDYIEWYSNVLIELQLDNGGFTWQLLNKSVNTDSSATAVFGWFLANSSMIFNDKRFYDSALKCRGFLMKRTRSNGVIDHCQGDTIGIGIYSRRFEPLPFGQAFALRMEIAIEKATNIFI